MNNSFRRTLVSLASLLMLFAAGAGLFAAPPAAAAPFTARQIAVIAAEGEEYSLEALEASGGSAFAAALMDAHGIVWEGHFGAADRSDGEAPDAGTMFGIGSVSKMLATASVMILVDRGLVDLDEPLCDVLPEFGMADPRYRDITVRMLLDHGAGFPGGDMRNAGTLAPWGGLVDQALQTLSMSRLKHEPGWMSVYCNDCFTVAEALVESVTGIDYPAFVGEEILGPLGMDDSHYMVEDFPAENYARVYEGDDPLPLVYFNIYGSGGLLSTPADMARFGMMLAGSGETDGVRILSGAAVREMGLDHAAGTFNPLPSEEMRYGLGWDTVAQPGLAAVGVLAWQKGGDIGGFYGASLAVVPDEDLVAVAMGASGVTSGNASRVVERLLLRALEQRRRIAAMPEPVARAPAAARTADIAERIDVEGWYASSGALLRARFDDAGALAIDRKSGRTWDPFVAGFLPRMDGRYSDDDPGSAWVRFVNADGRTYFGTGHTPGNGHYEVEALYGQKLDAAPPIPAAWEARTRSPWLLASEVPGLAIADDSTDPRMNISVEPGLPGHLFYDAGGYFAVRPVSDGMAAMFLLIPGSGGRDLNDLVAERVGGTDYLRVGGAMYRDSATVPALAKGRTTTRIGPEGLGEWRRITSPGTVGVTGATLWKLYGQDFSLLASGEGPGSATIPAAAGPAWLVAYADPGAALEFIAGGNP